MDDADAPLQPLDPYAAAGPPRARSACVIVGASPDEVAAAYVAPHLAIRANRLGTLVVGRLGSLPVDYAERFAGPVYDVMVNPATGWFCVTTYAGDDVARFEPGADGDRVGGYRRAADVRGATTPEAVLDALDVPRALLAPPGAAAG